MPALTVVVPCYNASKTLPATLDSILAQDWQDFEVICVDDGSIDGTQDVIARYSSKDVRVKGVEQKNQGVLAARMLGVSMSSAEYVAFVDADDFLESNHYSSMMCWVRKGCDLVVCGYRLVSDDGVVAYEVNPDEGLRDSFQALFVLLEVWRSGLYSMWNKIYRKNILLDVDLNDCPKYLWEDQVFNGKILTAYELTVAFVSNVGYNYLRQNNSLITGFNSRQIDDFFVVLNHREKWARELTSRGFCLKNYKYINLDEVFNFYGKTYRLGRLEDQRLFEERLWHHRHLVGWSAALRSPYRLARLVKFAFRLLRSRLAGRKALA